MSAVLKQPLEETLLTMDVVDELRHRKVELSTIANDDVAVLERLRAIYSSQGIPVSDEILNAGIRARHDQRFVYVPPRGWRVAIARAWIERRRVVKYCVKAAAAIAAVTAIAVFLASLYLVPKAIWLNNKTRALDTSYGEVLGSLRLAESEWENAERALLEALHATVPVTYTDLWQRASEEATADLSETQREFFAAVNKAKDPLSLSITTDAVNTDWEHLTNEIAQRSQAKDTALRLIAALREKSKTVSKAATLLRKADDDIASTQPMPREWRWLYSSAARAARLSDAVLRFDAASLDSVSDEFASTRVTLQNANDGWKRLGALRNRASTELLDTSERDEVLRLIGVVEQGIASGRVEPAMLALKDVDARLDMARHTLTYTIVSRPGVKSGVWRYSVENPASRNHYLIVEALDETGSATTLPIKNEENGRVQNVSLFGVRVPRERYEQVGRDKTDDGIIQDNVIGVKEAGRIAPQFTIDRDGGYITEW